MKRSLLAFVFFLGRIWAQQPAITGVTNSADYTLLAAPGSLAVVFGSNFAAVPASAPAIPLPTQLGGVSVKVNGRPTPLLYVGQNQVNIQIPYGTTSGTATVTVTSGTQTSASYQFSVASTAAGLYSLFGGHGIVQNQDYTLNSQANPALIGSTIVVYLTGIGATKVSIADGASPTNALATPIANVSAAIGDQNAAVQFIGLTPGLVGVAQANIQVPQLSTADYPMTISIDGHQSSSVLVSVKGAGAGFQVSNILTPVGSVAVPNGFGQTLAPDVIGLLQQGMAVYSNTLYLCGSQNIHILDITNPALPQVLDEFGDAELLGSGVGCGVTTTATGPLFLSVSGGGLSTRISAYSLQNPRKPSLASQISNPSNGRTCCAFSGNTGFFGQAFFYFNSGYSVYQTIGNIAAVDFTNPASPSFQSLLVSNPAEPETLTSHLRLRLTIPQPGLLYAASTTASNTTSSGTGALDLFDVTNPSNLRGIAEVQVPGTAILESIPVQGSLLLAIGQTTSLQSPGYPLSAGLVYFPITGNLTLSTFDITNPRSPLLRGTVVTSLRPDACDGVPLGGGFFALSCAGPSVDQTGPTLNHSLVIVDARNVTAPAAYTYAALQGLGGLVVNNGFLYAATITGVNAYKIQLP